MSAKQIEIPEEAPVMVLPGTLLFPHSLLPLFIFEPRYRAMLRWALERDRMFCVALLKPGIKEAETVEDFFHTAGIGMVRASVTHEDGTSHLMLQGLARVRFTGFTQLKPFRIARLEHLRSVTAPGQDAAAQAESVRELCSEAVSDEMKLPQKLEDYLDKVTDPDILADTVAHAFVRDPLRRQELMEETNVNERLLALIRHLSEEQTAQE